jgi:hypothetical protein
LNSLPFLNDLAELGARTARAPRCVILKSEVATGIVTVVGRFGSTFEPSDSNNILSFVHSDTNFMTIPDIRRDERFAGLPILDYVPRINSLIIANISPQLNYSPRYRFILFIFNSATELFENSEALSAVTHVVSVCRQCVSALNNEDAYLAESSATPLPAYVPEIHARQLVTEEANDKAAKYLMDTLQRKLLLHENELGGFISLRTWRKSIKSEQMNALKEAVKKPNDNFLETIATEFAVSAKKMFGANQISNIVRVPSSNARAEKKFSELISERVAEKLGAKVVNALQINNGRITSVFQKSDRRADMGVIKFVGAVEGSVLLLDNVSNSVNIICAAQGLLRQAGLTCFAMSWIGPI